MGEKVSVQNLIKLLADSKKLNKKDAEVFLKVFVELIEEALERDRLLKLKGLGTFKLIKIEDRESVDVNTGERFVIEGHNKVSFTPEPAIRDLINKPFSHFETVVLNENVSFEEEQTESLPASEDKETEETVIPDENAPAEEEESQTEVAAVEEENQVSAQADPAVETNNPDENTVVLVSASSFITDSEPEPIRSKDKIEEVIREEQEEIVYEEEPVNLLEEPVQPEPETPITHNPEEPVSELPETSVVHTEDVSPVTDEPVNEEVPEKIEIEDEVDADDTEQPEKDIEEALDSIERNSLTEHLIESTYEAEQTEDKNREEETLDALTAGIAATLDESSVLHHADDNQTSAAKNVVSDVSLQISERETKARETVNRLTEPDSATSSPSVKAEEKVEVEEIVNILNAAADNEEEEEEVYTRLFDFSRIDNEDNQPSAPMATVGFDAIRDNVDLQEKKERKNKIVSYIVIVLITVFMTGSVMLYIYNPNLFDQTPQKEFIEDSTQSQPTTSALAENEIDIPKETSQQIEALLAKPIERSVEDREVIRRLRTQSLLADTTKTIVSGLRQGFDDVIADSTSYIVVGTMVTYIVQQGETLTKISNRFYGTKDLWPYLVMHNKHIIKDANNVPAGTPVLIPALRDR